MDTLQTESTPEEHKLVITDVRFRPNSSQLATASVDKSVRLWDAANVSAFFLFLKYWVLVKCMKLRLPKNDFPHFRLWRHCFPCAS